MSTYYTNEAAFDLPDAGFVDRTVTYLEGKSPAGNDVVFLMERHSFPQGKSLRQVTTDHIDDARRRLRGYSVLSQTDRQVCDLPAIDVGVRWRDESGEPVYTRQVHVVVGETWLIVAGEVHFEDRELCDAYVEQVVGSLRLRD
jgi:hypothetical protein